MESGIRSETLQWLVRNGLVTYCVYTDAQEADIILMSGK